MPKQGTSTSIVDPVRKYLTDIHRFPLLTASQEVDLAMRLEGGELAGALLDSIRGSDRIDATALSRIDTAVILIRG